MDKDFILWLVLFVIFIVVEIMTISLTSIWFAVGSFLALITTFFDLDFMIQILLFGVVSVVLMIFTKPLFSKHFLNKRNVTNYESIIGQQAKVTERINNIENKGTVMINGLEWTARADGNFIIEENSIVEVVRVEGVKVIVKK